MSDSRQGFTVIEMIVVLTLIVVGIAIVLPMLGVRHGRSGRRQMENSTRVRGIHSALVLFAQGNNTYYPGLNTEGKPLEDTSVAFRFQVLLDDHYFASDYLISPDETDKKKKALGRSDAKLTSSNYSYAMLNLSVVDAPRMNEWRDTSQSDAVVVSDRAIANGKEGAIKSIHTSPKVNHTEWRGSVGFNDNHVTFEAIHDNLTTQYGDNTFTNDNLFDTIGASMVYEGNDVIYDAR